MVAVIAMFISRLRKRWYEDYLEAEEALLSTVLEKAGACAERGEHIGDEMTALSTVAALPGYRGSKPVAPAGGDR